MTAKKSLLFGLRVIALTIIMLLGFTIASTLSGLFATASSVGATADPATLLLVLLLSCLLQTVVLSYIIMRSRRQGWKLIGAIFLAFYGCNTVVAQIESLVYVSTQVPRSMIYSLFVMGAIWAAIFSPLAVVILGKWRAIADSEKENPRLVMPVSEWGWKLTVIVVGYLILYYTAGYTVSWRNPEVQAYYGGADAGSFFAQMAAIWTGTPWMLPYQILRALSWTVFALPVIRLFKGPAWETGLAIGLLFSVWNSQLLIPNSLMPEVVMHAHLVELVISLAPFGWLLSQNHSLARYLSPVQVKSAVE